MHNVGTVPMFKMHNIQTPIFYNLFLELEFGFYDQNKLLLIAFVFSFKPSKAHLPTPNPFSIMSQSRVSYTGHIVCQYNTKAQYNISIANFSKASYTIPKLYQYLPGNFVTE